jgi:hypothetical protein
LAYACAVLVLASEGQAEGVASALEKADGDGELRRFVLWLPYILDNLWHPFPDADGLTWVAAAPEGTSHKENLQAGEAFGWKPLEQPTTNRTGPTTLRESEAMLDFGHLKRLLPEEQHVYDRLENAFRRVNDCMRREEFFGPEFDRNAQDLAQYVRELDDTLTAAGAKKAPYEWEAVTGSESEAQQLLGMGQAASANWVGLLFGRLTVHDPVRWRHVHQHVARFGEAVLAGVRPAAMARVDGRSEDATHQAPAIPPAGTGEGNQPVHDSADSEPAHEHSGKLQRYRRGPDAKKAKVAKRNALIDKAKRVGIVNENEIFEFVRREDPSLLVATKKGQRLISVQAMMKAYNLARAASGMPGELQ